MIQVRGEEARFVLAEENGEGDLCGVGEVGIPSTFGPWEPMTSAPEWLRTPHPLPREEK